jgi:hypothetical protein
MECKSENYVRFEFPAPEENWIDSISSVASTIFQSGSDIHPDHLGEHTHTHPSPSSKGYRFLTSSTCSMSRKRGRTECRVAKTAPEHPKSIYISSYLPRLSIPISSPTTILRQGIIILSERSFIEREMCSKWPIMIS